MSIVKRLETRIIEPLDASFDCVARVLVANKKSKRKPDFLLIPQKTYQENLVLSLGVNTMRKVHLASKERGLSDSFLVEKIIKLTFQDNLLGAILDD